ncbi:hypothetical protein [Nocardioides xinjiangensis]|uniref:hypothetical protein n=1 Tax=Nocardioides xinjiangensis TaxID=2817376 RepID=UPI001B308D02|nr:hypothetical protein [Nocardioides sp. SYSU D00514]
MRSSLASIAALATLAALAPMGPAAHAAAPGDWRTAACADDNHDDLALGAYTVTQAKSHRVRQIRSLTLTAERLVFASGTRCDLLSVDGRVRGGHELTGHGSDMALMGELVVGGVSQGEMEGHSSQTGAGGTEPIRHARHRVLDAMVFRDVESGTVPDSAAVPEAWRNQPYTFTHTRTTFTATVTGRVARRKTFTVTPATTAAADRRLAAALAVADSTAERRAARKVHRLALRGVRVVMRKFRHDWSDELPR